MRKCESSGDPAHRLCAPFGAKEDEEWWRTWGWKSEMKSRRRLTMICWKAGKVSSQGFSMTRRVQTVMVACGLTVADDDWWLSFSLLMKELLMTVVNSFQSMINDLMDAQTPLCWWLMILVIFADNRLCCDCWDPSLLTITDCTVICIMTCN